MTVRGERKQRSSKLSFEIRLLPFARHVSTIVPNIMTITPKKREKQKVNCIRMNIIHK